MTEKIIIDGANVSGCDFVSKIGGCDSYTDGVCEGHNCEHKQLKRLEQENKELRRKAFLAEQNAQLSAAAFCEKDNKIIELEQENKELKELNKKICEDWEKEIKVYWNVLEEINITVKQLLKGVSANCINNTPYLTALSFIENKINEVLK